MTKPPPQLEMIITYLEMIKPPSSLPPPLPRTGARLDLTRAQKPPVGFYRYLYDAVGKDWMWYERRLMSDAQLCAIIHDERVEVFVLYANGVPAGYGELDFRHPPDLELTKFGMVKDFRGLGLGRLLLRRTIDLAWARKPRKLLVDTCNFDDPRALSMYQQNGFVFVRKESRMINDPRPF